ncbi:hypothetical protein FHS96_002631 [Sphingomonas zeicaulis]|uniref:hemerythrin domain-containing protein n=1 Tax=Sphingomonas zeicaulis TaxID=1632740 RepID=UPI003D1F531E
MSGDYAKRNSQGDHRLKQDDPAAIRLLKEEHHVFRELFDKAEASEGEALVPIAQELCMRLAVHMTIEEEILYPALKPVIGEEEVDEGIVEHQSGKRIIAELENLDGTEKLYKSKVHVLGEETVHHIDEEDEDLFEDAKEAHAAGKIDLDALGEKLRARQAALYDEIATKGEAEKTGDAVAEELETVGRG